MKHDADIEDEMTRRLALYMEELRAARRSAVILEFPAKPKPDGA
jgi:hypothetical protein